MMGKKKVLEKQAYDYIVKKILDKEWLPKERIKELAVAKELEISRTPIRNAFKRLEEDGYIKNVPNKGAVIRVPAVDISGFRERLEFVEIYVVHYLHKIEVRDIDYDANDLREVFDHLMLSLEDSTLAFEEIEYEFWAEFLKYANNQFMRSMILEILRGLIPREGTVRNRVVASREIKANHLEDTLIYLEERKYGHARRELRILFNQLSMNVIQGI